VSRAPHPLICVAALAALSLAGCGRTEGGGAGAGICTPFPSAAGPGALPPDAAAQLDDCLHRWGYALAAAPDKADAVAQATVAACTTSLTRWNQQGLSAGAGGAPAEALEAPSLLTGQPTNPIAQHYAYAQGRALFYVVQARAGKCAPPPATAAQSTR
jgi:hypothetical protein